MALAGPGVLAWTVAACGSNGAGTAAQQPRQAVSSTAAQAKCKLAKTGTPPAKTETATATQRAKTRHLEADDDGASAEQRHDRDDDAVSAQTTPISTQTTSV